MKGLYQPVLAINDKQWAGYKNDKCVNDFLLLAKLVFFMKGLWFKMVVVDDALYITVQMLI